MTELLSPALDASDLDDGFQDFLSEDEEEQTLLDQESVALERRMKTMGIRDGLELGKEDTLQQGFNEGFATGAARSFRFGKLRGALGTAVACGLLSEDMTIQAKACMTQLRTLEMDVSVHIDGKKDTSFDADNAVRQAHDMLKSIGLNLQGH